MKDVIVIYGPTAVGKSSIAIELAKLIDGEIISADSMQIYKHLDIGSAKVTVDEMQGINHYMIDIKQPDEEYSVAEYVKDAKSCIREIYSKNKTPIIVGGTGLYIKALIEDYDFGLVKKDDAFRNSLSEYSNEQIVSLIRNNGYDGDLDINNRKRLIRLLEIQNGEKQVKKESKNEFNYKLFAIVDDRQKIYERINNRVDKMVENGLLKEVEYIKSLNLNENSLAIKAIGYKELFPYIDGNSTLQECKEILKQKSRNYAKRQFTFMNQFNNLIKINFNGVELTAKCIKEIIENGNK